MEVTLNRRLGLSTLRALRSSGRSLSRTPINIATPNPAPFQRWTRAAANLADYGISWDFTERRPFEIAVTDPMKRVRSKWARNTTYAVRGAMHAKGIPGRSAREVGGGVSIVCPELLFVELAQELGFLEHILLGYELCGTYSRDASDPRSGPVRYGVEAVTSASEIACYMEQCEGTRGLQRAWKSLGYVRDNAWSPMEAVLAAFAVLPVDELGYDLGPVVLNPRKKNANLPVDATSSGSRVPDMLFGSSGVGFNYEGEEHLDLAGIASAASRLQMHPEAVSSRDELAMATDTVRAKYVDDVRRDRDLGAIGLTVFRVTKEDLYTRGGLDMLMGQTINALECRGGLFLGEQRNALRNSSLAQLRQEAIWSVLPGEFGRRAWRARVEAERNRVAENSAQTPCTDSLSEN